MRSKALPLTAGLAAAAVLAACTSSTEHKTEYKSAPAPRVGIAVGAKGGPTVTIGVVRTVGDGNEGAEFSQLAAGALVAKYRIGAGGGRKVALDVVDDQGTAKGSAAAVAKLIADKVVGIVYASDGQHVTDGVKAADAAGVPVLLPYDLATPISSAESKPGLWHTGPSADQAAATIVGRLRAKNLTRTLVLSEGTLPVALADRAGTSGPLEIGSGPGLTTRVVNAARDAGQDPDSVVVWASAADAARAVAALQQANVAAPIFLSPSALSPVFAETLDDMAQSGGFASPGGDFLTAGDATTDFSTSTQSLAFLAGLRAAAAEPDVMSLSGTKSFARDGAAAADRRSHDAVVALAVAAGKAPNLSPTAVADTLRTLQLSAKDGLAGSPLNFRSQDAVDGNDVVLLRSSVQASGERSAVGGSQPLSWFAVASGS